MSLYMIIHWNWAMLMILTATLIKVSILLHLNQSEPVPTLISILIFESILPPLSFHDHCMMTIVFNTRTNYTLVIHMMAPFPHQSWNSHSFHHIITLGFILSDFIQFLQTEI